MTEETIGKFEVLCRIGTGGMADVYRCRLRGVGGFEKTVVVKRIRPEHAADPAFVNMFLEEARLAANLDHPNIVQVFDVGEVDGSPYIAMEYVRGPTFSALIRQAHRHQDDRVVDACLGRLAHVVSGVCLGLHHAHTARAASGEPLGLVHRDVSPQNIIVSREGIPKLLDFGMAKATGALAQSQSDPGTIKGKLRYLPPERLTGVVDQRGDIFSLGVCLFEATTGENPYGPPGTDQATLVSRIASGQCRRPSQVVPGYPRALEDIVLAAIEPDLHKRCGSARELHERLEELVARPPFQASARSVASWIEELFPAAASEDSGPKPRMASVVTAQAPGSGVTSPISAGRAQPALPTASRRRTISPFNPLAAVLSPDTSTNLDLVARRRAPPPRRSRQWNGRAWAAVGAATLLALGVAATLRERQPGGRQPGPASSAEVVQAPPVDDGDIASPAVSSSSVAAAPAPPSAAAARPNTIVAGLAKTPGRRWRSRPVSSPASSPASSLAPAMPTAATVTDQAPRVSAKEAPPSEPAHITSRRPLDRVPPPNLPRVQRAHGREEIRRVLRQVEDESLRAGCSHAFARGITASLEARLLQEDAPDIYPASLYYLIVREAALGRDKQAAGLELASAHRSGLVKALNRLPVAQR